MSADDLCCKISPYGCCSATDNTPKMHENDTCSSTKTDEEVIADILTTVKDTFLKKEWLVSEFSNHFIEII